MSVLACFAVAILVPTASGLPHGPKTPKEGLLAQKARAAPALQPSEVYDKDYPVDMAKLTPEELRYKAQADYAKAIAALKKEAAEAEAAQREMEKALKDYQDAEAAARKAKLEAEDAQRTRRGGAERNGESTEGLPGCRGCCKEGKTRGRGRAEDAPRRRREKWRKH